jgi:hypothetical protein
VNDEGAPLDSPQELAPSSERADVSLRFFGDSLDPSELTRRLCREPSGAYRKGEWIRVRERDKLATTGSWRLQGAEPESESIEHQIRSLLEQVTDNLAVWQDLTARYEADVFVGAFFEFNLDFVLSAELVRLLQQRNLAIRFDVYAG